MAKQSKITISFSREYQDVYEFLRGQVNVSGLICKILREKISFDSNLYGHLPMSQIVLENEKNMETKSSLEKAVEVFEL